METSTWGNLFKGNFKDMESTNGKIKVFMKAHSKKERGKVKANGSHIMAISSKASM